MQVKALLCTEEAICEYDPETLLSSLGQRLLKMDWDKSEKCSVIRLIDIWNSLWKTWMPHHPVPTFLRFEIQNKFIFFHEIAKFQFKHFICFLCSIVNKMWVSLRSLFIYILHSTCMEWGLYLGIVWYAGLVFMCIGEHWKFSICLFNNISIKLL